MQEGSAVRVRRTYAHYNISLDNVHCRKCMLCTKLCPQNVFCLIGEDVVPIRKIDCVGCMVCVEHCPANAIDVVPLPLTHNFTWSSYIVDDIRQKAALGHHIVRGMGAKRYFPHFDDLVFLCAQTSRPPIDHYRVPCNTEVILGNRFAERR
jgi:NAD-dependent dihydropyrimidine dehydrogenase PreA subunit